MNDDENIFIDINNIIGPIVQLSKSKYYIKTFYDIYELINEDYSLTAVINCCNKHFNVFNNNDIYVASHNARDRNKWMYLNDYLQIMNIKNINEIPENMMFNKTAGDNIRNAFKLKNEQFLKSLQYK